MKYLIAYTEAGATQFCEAAFSRLQPTQPGAVTSAWTDYLVHPTTGIPLVSIPESFVVPIVAGVNVALFDFAFAKYLEDGIVTQGQIDALKTQTLTAAGGMMDLGAEIVTLFDGTEKLIDYAGAVEGGWIISNA